MKNLFFILFLNFILSIQYLNASNTYIQIGAFKEQKSIDNLKNKLHDYELKVKKKPNNLKVIYIICQNDKCTQEIKRMFPNSFIVKIEKNEKKCTKLPNKTYSFPNDDINSKTIINSKNIYFK